MSAIPTGTIPIRHTARLLVLDPADRLLLIQYEAVRDVDPARPGLRGFWFTPGGGLEPGESHEEAARRELEEETGITDAMIGPCVATRSALSDLFKRQAFTHERYFLVRAASDWLDISRLAETENDPVLDVRWWRLADLAASNEMVAPRELAAFVQSILDGAQPQEPVVLGL